MNIKFTIVTIAIYLFSSPSYSDEYCFSSTCFLYSKAEGVAVGGINLPDGKYKLTEVTSTTLGSENTKTQVETFIWIQGDNVEVKRTVEASGEKFEIDFRYEKMDKKVVINNHSSPYKELDQFIEMVSKVSNEFVAAFLESYGYFSSGEEKVVKKKFQVTKKLELRFKTTYTVLGVTKVNGLNQALIGIEEKTTGSFSSKTSGYLIADPDTGVRQYYETRGVAKIGKQEVPVKSTIEYSMENLN